MEYIEAFLWKFSSKICNINTSESHSNTIVHQFEATNPHLSARISWNIATLKHFYGDFYQYNMQH